MSKKNPVYLWLIVLVSLLIFMVCTVSVFKVSADDDTVVTSVDEVDDVSSDIEEQIIILYKEPGENNIADLELSKNEISEATSLGETVDVVTVPEGQDGDELIEKIEDNPNVEYALWNMPLTMDELPNDPKISNNAYYYTNSQIDDTWDIINTTADEVVVAVIDSGVNAVADDFEDRVYDVIDKYSPDDPKTDLKGHGTNVASNIVCAVNNGKGVAGTSGLSNVKVLPYRVGGASSTDTSLDLAVAYAAMDDIVNNHPEVKVLNMSFGCNIARNEVYQYRSFIRSMQSKMDKLYQAGIVIVASAGNSGDNSYNYPACCNHVLSVASVESDNSTSSFSTYNEYVDIAAVGRNVPVATKNGTYSTNSGTSFSSPIVAGACAFLISTTGRTGDEIVNAVCSTASHASSGRDNYTGYGVLQLKDAFEYLAGDIDFSVNVESREQYYEGDTITVTAACAGVSDMTYEFKVNNEIVACTDGVASIKIKDAGTQTIEVTGILPCGAQDTQTVSLNAEEKTFQKGDLNGDSIKDLIDVQLAKRAAMKDPTLVLATKEYLAGDLNGDQKITINEVRNLRRMELNGAGLQ